MHFYHELFFFSHLQAKLETKALKAKRPGFTDERYNETSYYYDINSSKYFSYIVRLLGTWVSKRCDFSRNFLRVENSGWAPISFFLNSRISRLLKEDGEVWIMPFMNFSYDLLWRSIANLLSGVKHRKTHFHDKRKTTLPPLLTKFWLWWISMTLSDWENQLHIPPT